MVPYLSVNIDVPPRFARGIVVGIRAEAKRDVHQLLGLLLPLFADGFLEQPTRGEVWLAVQPLAEVVWDRYCVLPGHGIYTYQHRLRLSSPCGLYGRSPVEPYRIYHQLSLRLVSEVPERDTGQD